MQSASRGWTVSLVQTLRHKSSDYSIANKASPTSCFFPLWDEEWLRSAPQLKSGYASLADVRENQAKRHEIGRPAPARSTNYKTQCTARCSFPQSKPTLFSVSTSLRSIIDISLCVFSRHCNDLEQTDADKRDGS